MPSGWIQLLVDLERVAFEIIWDRVIDFPMDHSVSSASDPNDFS
jgi:hypothetical protein